MPKRKVIFDGLSPGKWQRVNLARDPEAWARRVEKETETIPGVLKSGPSQPL